MEMPGYLDYGKMYDMTPAAFVQAQEQLGLAQQYQQGRQQRQQIDNASAGLDTMFKQDSYEDRLRQGKSTADLSGYQADDARIKNQINQKTESLQLDAAQKKLILDASDSELKRMENVAQQLAYSTNPEERAAGEQLIRMHRDFVKMRDDNKFRADEAGKQRQHAFALEAQRHKNQMARAQSLAKAKLDAKSATEKMSMDQRISQYNSLALQARAEGDFEKANMYYAELEYLNQLKAQQGPDTGAGKVDTGQVAGLPTVPPRAPPARPTGAAPQAPLQGIPPGAKQIGTSQGRPVYELNGKRYILE